jgi:hypothetical protein
MALRLSELARDLERRHMEEMHNKMSQIQYQAEQQSMRLLQSESAKMEQVMGESEMLKINSESQIAEAQEKFKKALQNQLREQREAHANELQIRIAEVEARANELRNTILEEKDKQFRAEKLALEARLTSTATNGVASEQKKFEIKLAEELANQAEEIRKEFEQEKEEALLDLAKSHATKLENVESSLKLQHSKSLASKLDAASREWDAERENIRLAIAQDFEEQLAAQLAAKESEARARFEAALASQVLFSLSQSLQV